MTMIAKVGLLSLLALVGTQDASAQSYEEYEAEEQGEKPKVKRAVREIIKGTYAKTNVGMGMYLGTYSGVLQPGTSIALAFGQDFYDQENMSMAWEVSFEQSLHNGMKFDEQGSLLAGGVIGPNQLLQGDIHTFAAIVMVEASWYVNRRFGIGIRGGGGIMLTPLLVFEDSYKNVMIPTAWGNNRPAIHDSPHPLFGGGPTFEYYTKLSHFSIGADVNGFYALGLDLGLSATGYLKYTF